MSWKQYLELTELARNKRINFLVYAEKACKNGLISHNKPNTIIEKEYNLLKKGLLWGTEMTAEEIVQNYQTKLLKIIFKEIDNLIKKKEKADFKAHELAKNSNSVNSSAYWKSLVKSFTSRANEICKQVS